MEEGTLGDGAGEGKTELLEKASVGKRRIGKIRRTIRHCTNEVP